MQSTTQASSASHIITSRSLELRARAPVAPEELPAICASVARDLGTVDAGRSLALSTQIATSVAHHAGWRGPLRELIDAARSELDLQDAASLALEAVARAALEYGPVERCQVVPLAITIAAAAVASGAREDFTALRTAALDALRIVEPAPLHEPDSHAAPCALTVLRTLGSRVATKRHALDGSGEWRTLERDRVGLWRVSTLPVKDIDSLHAALCDLALDPRACVISGQLNTAGKALHAERGKVRRLDKAREDEREPSGIYPATVEDLDRLWLVVDVDGYRLKPYHWTSDAMGLQVIAVDVIREVIGPLAESVSCVVQYSASTGIKGEREVSLHLWLWLDRAVCRASLMEWAMAMKARASTEGRHALDTSPYKAAQVCYTAAPVFEGGAADPMPHARKPLLIRGDRAALTLPSSVLCLEDQAELDARKVEAQRVDDERARAQRRSERQRAPETYTTRRESFLQGRLRYRWAQIRERLQAIRAGGKAGTGLHPLVWTLGRMLGGIVAGWGIDFTERDAVAGLHAILDTLSPVVRAHYKTAADAVASGMSAPLEPEDMPDLSTPHHHERRWRRVDRSDRTSKRAPTGRRSQLIETTRQWADDVARDVDNTIATQAMRAGALKVAPMRGDHP